MASGRVIGFEEKPVDPAAMPNDATKSLASMGIYVFNREFLVAQLTADARDPDSSHDFGKNIIPRLIDDCRVYAYPFVEPNGGESYWRDVGTVDAFWESNLELAHV